MGISLPNSLCPEGALEEHQWQSEASRIAPVIPGTRDLLVKNPKSLDLDLQTEVHKY